MRARLLLPLALLLALPSGTAGAAPRGQNFGAHLTGAAERPTPRETPARGQAKFHLSRDGSTIAYRLIASNIENVTAAHIHCPADENGTAPPVVTLYSAPAGGGRHDGVLSTGSFDPADFPCGATSMVEAMRTGLAYVNVHTNDGDGTPDEGPGDFPGGEIRGQIEAHGPKR